MKKELITIIVTTTIFIFGLGEPTLAGCGPPPEERYKVADVSCTAGCENIVVRENTVFKGKGFATSPTPLLNTCQETGSCQEVIIGHFWMCEPGDKYYVQLEIKNKFSPLQYFVNSTNLLADNISVTSTIEDVTLHYYLLKVPPPTVTVKEKIIDYWQNTIKENATIYLLGAVPVIILVAGVLLILFLSKKK